MLNESNETQRKKPQGVPDDARYAALEGWFEVVERKEGRRFGPMRAFRNDDGSLTCEARFDDQGRLQGTYKAYHRDGTVAREGTFNEGAPVGTWTYRRRADAYFPVEDPNIVEAAVTFSRESRKWLYLDAKGRERIPGESIDESVGSADALFADVDPANVLTSGVFAKVAEKSPVLPASAASDDGFFAPVRLAQRKAFSESAYPGFFGHSPPEALTALMKAGAGRPLMFGSVTLLPNILVAGDRPFDALVAEYQSSPGRAVGLRELFMGLIPVATDPRGVRYGLSLDTHFHQPTNAVYLFDPSDDEIVPVARTLEDFAMLLSLESAASSLSRRALERAYRLLIGRVDPRGPFESLFERAIDDDDGETHGDEQADHREGFRFRRPFLPPLLLNYRSRWIRQLLLGRLEGAYQAFSVKMDGGLGEARLEHLGRILSKDGPLSVYWLLRCYFLGDPHTRTVLRFCKDSPSTLTQEVAALVDDLLDGKRRALGSIEDVGALSTAFQAMYPLEKREDEDGEEDEDEDGEQDEE